MKNIAVPDEIHTRIKALSVMSGLSMAKYISVLVVEASVPEEAREKYWEIMYPKAKTETETV